VNIIIDLGYTPNKGMIADALTKPVICDKNNEFYNDSLKLIQYIVYSSFLFTHFKLKGKCWNIIWRRSRTFSY